MVLIIVYGRDVVLVLLCVVCLVFLFGFFVVWLVFVDVVFCGTFVVVFKGNLSHRIWRRKRKLLCGAGVRCLFGAPEKQVPLSLAVLRYH